MRFAHVGAVVIVIADSGDFRPVAQKVKAAGRTLIGFCYRKTACKQRANSSHVFRCYSGLMRPVSAEAAKPAPSPPSEQAGI
jgi:hypothetical protein